MAIKTRFVMPDAAFYAMRECGYVGTAEAMFTQFCGKFGITDSIIRSKAIEHGITITESVRRLVVDKHPKMYDVWPAKRMKPRADQAITPGLDAHQQTVASACRIIQSLIDDRDCGHARRRGLEFIKHHKP